MKVNKSGTLWQGLSSIDGFKEKYHLCFKDYVREGEGNVTPIKRLIYEEALQYSEEMIDLIDRMTDTCYKFFIKNAGKQISEYEKYFFPTDEGDEIIISEQKKKKSKVKAETKAQKRAIVELTTCHYCKQKKENEKYHCNFCHHSNNPNETSKTKGNFCHKCMSNHFPRMKQRLDSKSGIHYIWRCPQCRGICDCKRCKVSKYKTKSKGKTIKNKKKNAQRK